MKTTGGNIYIRELEKKDASEKYIAWLNDPEINQFLESRFLPEQTINSLKNFINECFENDAVFLFGIFLSNDNSHIGNIKLGPINKFHKRADLGFLIGDKHSWGKGYATKAIRRVLDYGFNELGLEKITAGCYSSNHGSKAAMLKAGFSLEGVLKDHWFVDEIKQDGLIFGITKESWGMRG